MSQRLPQNPRARAKSAVALVLTFAAGTVDIVGYLAIFHLFAANMTGNTVHVGHYLVIGEWREAAKAGSIICSFVAGSILARSFIEIGSRKRLRSVASFALFIEAVLILSVVWLGPVNQAHAESLSLWAMCWMLSLLALAMGLQTATLTRIGPLTIHTTFVTGMLNKMAQGVSEWLFWLHDQWKQNARWSDIVHRSPQVQSFRAAWFTFAIWVCYLLGSVTGTWMNSLWGTRALYLPVVLMTAAIAVDQFQPLTVEEEKEQS